ncbi:MAG: transglycosylase SLT domain-containing protein [Nitrospirales bacterium]|nr:transglycosylase SLT domain-containing protein [Nitrospira sp.]MDR4500487.1 transglycosylase SLT domain-containing protein [Nitrospirales bacterium]
MNIRSTRRSTISAAHLALVSVFFGVTAFSAQPLPSPQPAPVQCHSAESCYRQAFNPNATVSGSVPPESYAVAGLKKVLAEYPGTPWAHRAGVHLGLMLKDTAPAEAITYFRGVKHEFPLLEDYLNYWTAQALLNARQPHEAALLFEEVAKPSSQSRLRNDALVLAGQARRDSDNCESAMYWYRQVVERAPQSSLAAMALLEIGDCQVLLNQTADAQKTFREIWWKFPYETEGQEAQVRLEQLPEAFQQEPTLEEQYQHALSWYKAARFEQALPGFHLYIRQTSPGKERDEAEYKLGMAFASLKRYDEAEKVFDQVARSQSRRKQDGTVWLARSYLRQGKGREVLDLQKKTQTLGLSKNRQALLHIFAGVWLNDQGKTAEALEAFRTASQVARSVEKRQDALWRMTWIYYEQKQYARVLETLETLLRSSKDAGVMIRAQYWKGRVYEQLKKDSQAQETFRNLWKDQPFTYYGQLAKARLSEPVSSSPVGVVKTAVQQASSATQPDTQPAMQPIEPDDLHFKKAQALVDLGLLQEATKELRAVSRHTTSKQRNLASLLDVAQQAGAYDLGIRLAIQHHGYQMKQDQLPRSAYAWEGAYPTGYLPTIQQYVPSGLDPYLVAGLIREESLYDTRAMSRVGALGLMQLMPTTARKVALRLGLQAPHRDDLFDAAMNIQLGSTYVGELLAQFKGNIVHAVAAYNAGPHVVRRWIAQDPHVAPDEFVERISYRETRGYVKRVLGSYRVYRALFDQSCRAVSLDRMC